MNLIMPRPGFLQGLRAVCDKHGAVLIFDEVMTGFRVHPRGVQGLMGITPDLTTLGKVIGGGMPVGAFGGKRTIMEKIAPLGPVYQAGTLSGTARGRGGARDVEGNPGTGFFEALSVRAKALTDGLNAAAKRVGVAVCAQSVGGMFGLYCGARARQLRRSDGLRQGALQPLFHAMLDAGSTWRHPQYERFVRVDRALGRDIAATVVLAEKAFAAVR
jgi:glutamate-1-semialdehyde 2,1-aminomutase